VADIAMTKSMSDHIEIVKKWAALVWKAWSAYHDAVAELAARGTR